MGGKQSTMKRLSLIMMAFLLPVTSFAEIEARFTSENLNIRKTNTGYQYSLKPGSRVVGERIIQAINEANDSIWISVAHFNYSNIAQALVEKVKSNPRLDVRVIVDQGDLAQKSHQGKYLAKNGVPVRIWYYSFKHHHPYSKIMHHKLILIDGKTLITGSFNWSNTAETENFENILVLKRDEHPQVVQAYIERYEKLWNQNRGVNDSGIASFKQMLVRKKSVPLHFGLFYKNEMALSYDEINDVSHALAKAYGYDSFFGPNGLRNRLAEEHVCYSKTKKQSFPDWKACD